MPVSGFSGKTKGFTDNNKTISHNNISLLNKKTPNYPDPILEYKRLGYTDGDIETKTPDERMKMEWFLESECYLSLSDEIKIFVLDHILDRYEDIRPEHYINVRFDKAAYYEEVKIFYDKKIETNGSTRIAIGDEQPELLEYFKKKYNTVVIKDKLVNPGKLYEFSERTQV